MLADIAARPLKDVFAKRQVIVPSVGIKRDIQLAVARDTGICALLDCPFLGQWLWDQIGRFVPVPAVSPFSPQRMTWRLYRILGDANFVGKQPRLQSFLSAADSIMQLELAERVAGLFEQLLTYRPEWLDSWANGKAAASPKTQITTLDEAWQSALWRRILLDLGTEGGVGIKIGMGRQHPVSHFFTAIEADQQATAKLPESVQIFALHTLPPLYLQMLERLSAYIDIDLYLLNPCAEYWFDIVDPKRLKRLAAQGTLDFHETGNRLLASWGKQTQSMLGLVFEQTSLVEASASFVVPPIHTLLGYVQSSILHLQPLEQGPTFSDSDRSIEVHVCHSLFRELEVLHDRLLGLRIDLPDLQADQILVVLPDLNAAAPLIDAVFGSRGGLPYNITGRPSSYSNPVVRSLLAIVDAVSARLLASQGIALLRDPLIARQFGFDEENVEWLIQALQEAGLRWGLDGAHKVCYGLPNVPRHTWQDALSRLLLAYACPSDDQSYAANPFIGQLPSGSISASQAKILGLLWRFLEQLKYLVRQLQRPHTAVEWQEIWLNILSSCLAPNENEIEDACAVRESIADLAIAMNEGEVNANTPFTFPLSVARAALAKALDASPRGGISGNAITFAPLASLRNLPFRVVCVLGLNDGIFPSQQRPLEFDLLAAQYRPGDRQRQIDERNLFLDLLLAARDNLHLSYTGRSQRDDSVLPPSILIAELLETIADAAPEKAQHCVLQHPLHSFSRRYFETRQDPRLFSFDQADLAAWQTPEINPIPVLPKSANGVASTLIDDWDDSADPEIVGDMRRQPQFFRSSLPAIDHSSPLYLAELQSFFRHPARYLLRNTLGIRLDDRPTEIEDTEPLLLQPPLDWRLTERLLPHAFNQSIDLNDLARLAFAGVELPDGGIGQAQSRPLLAGLQQFAKRVNSFSEESHKPIALLQTALTLTLHGGTPIRVVLQLKNIQSGGLLRYRYAPISAGDIICAWLDHLALCALKPEGVLLKTTHIGCISQNGTHKIEQLTFNPVASPVAEFCHWVQAFADGQRQPLPFPPKTAWAWFSAEKEKQDKAARTAWLNAYEQRGEGLDPWWQLAWRGQFSHHDLVGSDVFESMTTLANTLFAPLQAHLAEPLVQSSNVADDSA